MRAQCAYLTRNYIIPKYIANIHLEKHTAQPLWVNEN